MNNQLDLQIVMGGQTKYAEAVKKYGQAFAEAVVANELQLTADNLNCFDMYAERGPYQELIEENNGTENAGFCSNSRQWIDFWLEWFPAGCFEESECEDCPYYQIRRKTAYYRNKARILKEVYE